METLYIDADDAVIDGTNAGIIAVRRAQNSIIEVWASDGESRFGSMPPDSTVAQINFAAAMYERGYQVGRRVGASEKAHEIRRALDIS